MVDFKLSLKMTPLSHPLILFSLIYCCTHAFTVLLVSAGFYYI